VSNGRCQRSSIFSGVLLIVVGVLFLMHSFVPGFEIGRLFWRYWPLLLIIWGIAKLYDHIAAQRTGEAKPGLLSGGEVGLILLVLVLVGAAAVSSRIHSAGGRSILFGPEDWFAKTVSASQELPTQPIKPGALVSISTGHGNITVHPGEGDELRVVVNKSATASSEKEAQRRLEAATAVVHEVAGGYEVRPQAGDEGSVRLDLELQVPKQVSISARTDHGDISISDLAGPITASSQKGSVEIHGTEGDVNVELQHGDARITSVRGNLRLSGHGNEVEIEEIAGDASIEGEFYGPVRVRNVAKTTRFASSRTDLTIVQLTGQLECDSRSMEISDVAGSLNLATKERDITLENIAGRIHVVARHGDIQVRFQQPPRDEVEITNDSGGIDVSLPGKSSFEISASSHSGHIENDFEAPTLKAVDEHNVSKLEGQYGPHGPKITLATSYGSISLRKST
jgi:DUF4097 and DUF4098 domain-containing protein YvlB